MTPAVADIAPARPVDGSAEQIAPSVAPDQTFGGTWPFRAHYCDAPDEVARLVAAFMETS